MEASCHILMTERLDGMKPRKKGYMKQREKDRGRDKDIKELRGRKKAGGSQAILRVSHKVNGICIEEAFRLKFDINTVGCNSIHSKVIPI